MKQKFKYRLSRFMNYHFSTHFLESESERVVYDFLVKEDIYFKCQVKIAGYRVDFLIGELVQKYVNTTGSEPRKDIIIEIDGPHHKNQTSYDQARDIRLNAEGYKIIHVVASDLWSSREFTFAWLRKKLK